MMEKATTFNPAKFRAAITGKPIGYKLWWEELEEDNFEQSLEKMMQLTGAAFPHMQQLLKWCLDNPNRARSIMGYYKK